jgi:hypothetical protein
MQWVLECNRRLQPSMALTIAAQPLGMRFVGLKERRTMSDRVTIRVELAVMCDAQGPGSLIWKSQIPLSSKKLDLVSTASIIPASSS